MRKCTLTMGLLLLCLAFSASGCQKKSTAAEESSSELEKTEEKGTGAEGEELESEEETKSASEVSGKCLTELPEITLTDSLSSQYIPFSLTSGNYGWKQDKGGSQPGQGKEDIIHTAACGIHPLEQDGEKADKLHVPDYNQMGGAPYTVSCAVMPDKITVTGWGVENLGKLESQAEETAVYEGEFLIQLKAGMVYELRAVWEEEQLPDRGFSGEASYIFMTDGNPDSQTVRKSENRQQETGISLYASVPFTYEDADWELQTLVQEDMLVNGELAVDDQGYFRIQAASGNDIYVLFDDMVQLGMPEADVWTDTEGRLHITLRDVRTARYRVTDFVYDEIRKEFSGSCEIDGEGINYLGTTER